LRAIPPITIETILKLQLLVAWAGEAARLGWWKTNLIDRYGGLDLFRRLAPRTGDISAWEQLRLAATAVDLERRRQQADPDRLITLFHLGHDVDEAIADHIRHIKVSAGSMSALIPEDPDHPEEPWNGEGFVARLTPLGAADVETTPTGRRIRTEIPVGHDVRAKRLAAALLPLAPQYPLPYFRLP
jgi:hypothetical protein